MKRLYLLRHAKSSWKDPGLSDKQRPLNKRGKRDAPEMAQRFAERGEDIEGIISSPALRARSTAQAFAAVNNIDRSQILELESLYFYGLTGFTETIRQHGGGTSSLLLASHNPDLTVFANTLDKQLTIDNVPTCGLLAFDCDTERWEDWSPKACRFVYYDYPKNPSIEPLFNTRIIR